jgi:hypothetical protein
MGADAEKEEQTHAVIGQAIVSSICVRLLASADR